MKVKEKLQMDLAGLEEHGPVTIVAVGDSVTHGAVAAGEINYETVYWNRLRQKLNVAYPAIPVNVINAGINGTTASRTVHRLERQVLSHTATTRTEMPSRCLILQVQLITNTILPDV